MCGSPGIDSYWPAPALNYPGIPPRALKAQHSLSPTSSEKFKAPGPFLMTLIPTRDSGSNPSTARTTHLTWTSLKGVYNTGRCSAGLSIVCSM